MVGLTHLWLSAAYKYWIAGNRIGSLLAIGQTLGLQVQ
jgi:hypothetical protein